MKKIYFSLIVVLIMIMTIPYSYAKNNVKVYMFTKNGCSACERAYNEFTKKLEEDENAFELINIEVWCGENHVSEKNNWIVRSNKAYNLMDKVVKYFNKEITGTPTIVVGNHYQADASNLDELFKIIEDYQNDKKYTDVVSKIAKENNINIDDLIVEHGSESCDIYPQDENSETGKYDLLIVAGIFVILIGGFAGLILISKK